MTEDGYFQILREGTAEPSDPHWKKYSTYRDYVRQYKKKPFREPDFLRNNARLAYYTSDGRLWSRYIITNERYAGHMCMKEYLFDERLRARQNKEYAKADEIRDYYQSCLVTVIDGVH